jgi:hypothetical protein
MKNQQAWFIKSFGTNINLGNIEPGDVIALETLRSGLRGDTFATFASKMEHFAFQSGLLVKNLADNRSCVGFPQFSGNTTLFDQYAKSLERMKDDENSTS